MREVKFCDHCGKRLKKPTIVRENYTLSCYDCWSQTEHGKKLIQEQEKKTKCSYFDKNLEAWK